MSKKTVTVVGLHFLVRQLDKKACNSLEFKFGATLGFFFFFVLPTVKKQNKKKVWLDEQHGRSVGTCLSHHLSVAAV